LHNSDSASAGGDGQIEAVNQTSLVLITTAPQGRSCAFNAHRAKTQKEFAAEAQRRGENKNDKAVFWTVLRMKILSMAGY